MDVHGSGDAGGNGPADSNSRPVSPAHPENRQKRPISATKIPKRISTKKGRSPKANANGFRPNTSVIYGSAVPHKGSGNSLSKFKEPWVPAPGKASPSRKTVFNDEENRDFAALERAFRLRHLLDMNTSFNTTAISTDSQEFPHYQQYREEPLPDENEKLDQSYSSSSNSSPATFDVDEPRETSSRRERKQRSSFTLKTKDSLMEVTNFIHGRRAEIQQVLQHFRNHGDPDLADTCQKADQLALEAANEVDVLRESIISLHQKDSSLSEDDCQMLEGLRVRVLSKIKDFEDINAQVPRLSSGVDSEEQRVDIVVDKSTSPPSKVKQTATTTPARRSASLDNETQAIYVKKDLSHFNAESSSDENPEYTKTYEVPPRFKPGQQRRSKSSIRASQSKSNTTATAASSTTTTLSKLAQMYNEQYLLPPPGAVRLIQTTAAHTQTQDQGPTISTKSVRFNQPETSDMAALQQQLNSLIQLLGRSKTGKPSSAKIPESNDLSDVSLSFSSDNEFLNDSSLLPGSDNKEKVKKLQKKLMAAEAEIESFKEDLQHVETQSNFEVRMLKSNMEDRLQSLEDCIEMFQATNMELRNALDRANAKLQQPSDESRLRILEKENEDLKQQLRDRTKDVEELKHKLEESAPAANVLTNNPSSRSFPSQQDVSSRTSQAHLEIRNRTLEMKVKELKERLAKSHKNIHILQVTKEKLKCRYEKRQEEILHELEESRAWNRQLQSNIHLLRTNYHELFTDKMPANPLLKPMKRSKTKRHNYRSKDVERKASTQSDLNHRNQAGDGDQSEGNNGGSSKFLYGKATQSTSTKLGPE